VGRVAELGSLGLYHTHVHSRCVFASIFDDTGRILLVRHGYGLRHWSTPGGRVEPQESPIAALLREVNEEIACQIRITHLIGVYAKPYRDDLVLSFAATIVAGSPQACLPEISISPSRREIRFLRSPSPGGFALGMHSTDAVG